MNVDPTYTGDMVFLCDITFRDTGEVIRDVVPAEARKQFAGRDFRETYSYHFKGTYTPYTAGLADSYPQLAGTLPLNHQIAGVTNDLIN